MFTALFQYLHHKSDLESCNFSPRAKIALPAIDADQILNFRLCAALHRSKIMHGNLHKHTQNKMKKK